MLGFPEEPTGPAGHGVKQSISCLSNGSYSALVFSCLVQKIGELASVIVAQKVKSLTIHCFTWKNAGSVFITVAAASHVARSC